jgi:hypothetical protein
MPRQRILKKKPNTAIVKRQTTCLERILASRERDALLEKIKAEKK